MSIIGQAVIDVRPDMGKFKTQVRSGIGEAVKFAAGAFAVGGAVEFFKSSIEGAVQLQEVTRRLDTSLKAIGADTQHTRDRADAFLKTLQSTSQFTRADLTDSLNRAVIGLGSFRKGMELTNLTANVARARGKDLAETQVALQRVFAGNVGSLRRLGIAFTATTPNTTALKDKLAELKTKLDAATGSEKDHIKQLIEVAKGHAAAAKAADKRAAVEQAIALLHKRFGEGVADFANTAAGRIAKLQNDLRSLQVEIGTALLPAVEVMVAAGMRFVDWLKTLGPEITSVAHAIEPLAQGLANIASAIGAAPILAAIGTYIALSKAVGVVTGITTAYSATATRLAAAQAAAAASAATLAAAEQAQAAAAAEGAAATTAAAAAADAAGVAAGSAAAGVGVLDVAFAALGGPVGLVVVGLAAAVAAIIYFGNRTTPLAAATRDAANAANELAAAYLNLKDVTAAASGGQEALTRHTAHLADEQAKNNVALAKQALATSGAAKGTAQYRELQLALTSAVDHARDAHRAYTTILDAHRLRAVKVADASARVGDAIDNEAQAVNRQAREATKAAAAQVLVQAGMSATTIANLKARRAADDFATALRRQKPAVGENATLINHNRLQLALYAEQIHRTPDKKHIAIILNNKDVGASLEEILKGIDLTGKRGGLKGKQAGTEVGHGFFTGLTGKFASAISGEATRAEGHAQAAATKLSRSVATGIAFGFQAAVTHTRPQAEGTGQSLAEGIAAGVSRGQSGLNAAIGTLITLGIAHGKTVAKIKSPSQISRDELGIPLGEGIAVGILDGKKNVIGAMRSTIIDAVTSAKQGLAGLASSLSGTVGQLLDARLAASPQGKALAAAQAAQSKIDYAQQLADANAAVTAAIVGSKERAKAEADLAVLVAQHNYDAAAAKVDAQKTSDDKVLADLADALNRGLITQKTYQQRVTALLKSQGVTYSAAGKALGLAFADGFLAQLQDMLQQANAITQIGLPGSGLNSGVKSPLDDIRQGVRDARSKLRQDEKAAKDSSGPGGKKITAAEHRQIIQDERMLKALEAIEKAAKRVVIENLNISAGTDATAKKLAEELINELAAAAR